MKYPKRNYTVKRKTMKVTIRPMRGPIQVKNPDYDAQDLMEFIGGMGYLIYEDPTDNETLIITDKVMTYSDYRKSRMVKGSEKWFDETYAEQMKEELAEYRW